MFLKLLCPHCGNNFIINKDGKIECFFCQDYSAEQTERHQWIKEEQHWRYGPRHEHHTSWYRDHNKLKEISQVKAAGATMLDVLHQDAQEYLLKIRNAATIYIAEGVLPEQLQKLVKSDDYKVKVVKGCSQEYLWSLVDQTTILRREQMTTREHIQAYAALINSEFYKQALGELIDSGRFQEELNLQMSEEIEDTLARWEPRAREYLAAL